MARVLVRDDSGATTWTERVSSADFDTEHFRRCLAERLWWAVADAESRWRAAGAGSRGAAGAGSRGAAGLRAARDRRPAVASERELVSGERELVPA